MSRYQPRRRQEKRLPDGFGLFMDLLCTIGVVTVGVALVPLLCLGRRITSANSLPLKEDLKRSFGRSLSYLPHSILRYFYPSTPRAAAAVLYSARFGPSRENVCIKVSTQAFSGYWICRGSPGKPRDPAASDTVLLWFHGGAYCFGGALASVVMLLRVAEILSGSGVSLSIFSVEYTLAPDGVFPQQQQEAAAAYRYLVEEERVDPGKVVVAGESAGGHLALACLLALAEQGLSKPGAALLLYPWVNMTNSGSSFERNRHMDVLVKKQLDRCAMLAVGPEEDGKWVHLLNLTEWLGRRRKFGDVMPSYTWINVGSHDLLLNDITAFSKWAALGGAKVDLEITNGEPHGWQLIADWPSEREYLATDPRAETKAGVMPGSECVARGLLAVTSLRN